jgi:hypothetical protein
VPLCAVLFLGKMERNGHGGTALKKGSDRSKSTSSDLYHVNLAVMLSLLAWPVTYFLNNGFEKIDQTVRLYVI